MKKKLLTFLSLLTVAAISIAGTVAYLTDSDSDVNVMTLGNVDIVQNEQQRGASGSLEAFENDKKLLPAVYGTLAYDDEKLTINGKEYNVFTNGKGIENVVDKIVTVTNKGFEAAYVRTLIAFEDTDGISEYIHFKSNGAVEFPANGDDCVSFVKNGATYVVGVYTYDAPLAAGETSEPSLMQLFWDKTTTNEILAKAGDKYEVLVLSQAVQAAGFTDAETALNEAFGAVTYDADETVAQWFNAASIETSGKQNDPNMNKAPANAASISNYDEFVAAASNGGDYKIVAPIDVTASINISADTNLYNEDEANVLTFAKDAKITIAADTKLALYGVEIDGAGTYEMNDGTIVYDADARRTDALLKAYEGSTLTVGYGTNIENVVSKGSAVIWAKGTVDKRATVVVKGATIQNCAGESGAIINVDKAGDVYIEEGTVISGNASYNNNNHGIIRIYNAWDAANPSTVTMNGGVISGNYYSGNGMIGLYYGKMIMNGGEICNNSWFVDNQKHNGWYPVIYVHSNSQFIMNDGKISGNTIKYGVLNSLNSSLEGAITINGGTVTNNIDSNNENKDALAAVAYPNTVRKSLIISDKATVTGTVWNYYDENENRASKYNELSEFLGN